jgi:hypothetical protein
MKSLQPFFCAKYCLFICRRRHKVGNFYKRGRGVPANTTEAARWYVPLVLSFTVNFVNGATVILFARVRNACSVLMRCARYARAAAAGMLKSKEELDIIHASRCNSKCDDDAGHAKETTKFSYSPQSSTPPSTAAAPSESDYAPARAEGLHSSVERAIAIAKCFARNTHLRNNFHHNSTEAVVGEGCRVRVKVL